jgi:hypothetical protein
MGHMEKGATYPGIRTCRHIGPADSQTDVLRTHASFGRACRDTDIYHGGGSGHSGQDKDVSGLKVHVELGGVGRWWIGMSFERVWTDDLG